MIYTANRQGEIIGYATVLPARFGVDKGAQIISLSDCSDDVANVLGQTIEAHHPNCFTQSYAGKRLGMVNTKGRTYRYAKGKDPKDMIEDAIPFIYDIAKDHIKIGYAGEFTGWSNSGIIISHRWKLLA